MSGVREFLNSKRGRWVGGAVGVVGLGVVLIALKANLGPNAAEAASRRRTFIDAKTGQAFERDVEAGMTVPVKAPSGSNTGFPAEFCYWTADGQTKQEPTVVLLNSYLNNSQPTFCPDCRRLVVGHNPKPKPGGKPPPTEGEYAKARSNRDKEKELANGR